MKPPSVLNIVKCEKGGTIHIKAYRKLTAKEKAAAVGSFLRQGGKLPAKGMITTILTTTD